MINEKLHVAIIMDGNSRWAKLNNLPKIEGHRQGANNLRNLIKNIKNFPISHLTLFAFSHENWKRPFEEIDYLMNLMNFYLDNEINNLNKNNIKLQIIGERDKLKNDIIEKINYAEKLTKNNDGLTLTLAISYGGRQEILYAAKQMFMDIIAKKIEINDINEELFKNYFYLPNLPDPDIFIRTSGEKRISNFLLWQISYSELFFIDENWPDFKIELLEKIIHEFYKRDRRFGERK